MKTNYVKLEFINPNDYPSCEIFIDNVISIYTIIKQSNKYLLYSDYNGFYKYCKNNHNIDRDNLSLMIRKMLLE